MRAWKALASFRGQARFSTWLHRIAVNVCLNRVAVRAPGDRTNVDVVKDWIYPLHSGHAFGLVGQIIICLTGLAA